MLKRTPCIGLAGLVAATSPAGGENERRLRGVTCVAVIATEDASRQTEGSGNIDIEGRQPIRTGMQLCGWHCKRLQFVCLALVEIGI
jgi:hypothetical protein